MVATFGKKELTIIFYKIIQHVGSHSIMCLNKSKDQNKHGIYPMEYFDWLTQKRLNLG